MRHVASKHDLQHLDLRDWQDSLRLSLLLGDELRRLNIESWRLIQTYQLGLATMGDAFSAEGRTAALKKSFAAMQRILALLQPWEFGDENDKPEIDSCKKLKKRWEEVWGRVDDPATQAKIAKTAAWLTKNTAPKRRK